MLRGAPGNRWSRVLWARGEARTGGRGEARPQAGGPHCVRADRPLQGLQVGANNTVSVSGMARVLHFLAYFLL